MCKKHDLMRYGTGRNTRPPAAITTLSAKRTPNGSRALESLQVSGERQSTNQQRALKLLVTITV
jgi:hypothetical protein